jgi:hypothetical protein
VVLAFGDVAALVPRVQPERVYDVVPPPVAAPAQERLDPIRALLRECPGSHPARPLSSDGCRSLADLVADHEGLATWLRTSAPADPTPEARRLTEERAWLASVPDRPGSGERAAALQGVDRQLAALGTRAGERSHWLEQHRSHLDRWADLSQAITWRQAALARGAEIRPTVAVLSQLGSPPTQPSHRPAWRRAAQAVESYRERWSLPDRPLELGPTNAALPPERGKRAEQLRVLAAAGELRLGRERDHVLTR